MNSFDIPLFKKTYDLYRVFYGYRSSVPKQDRYAIWQRCDTMISDVLEGVMHASQIPKEVKMPILEKTSRTLNMLRVFLRLMKETRTLDMKKYVTLESAIDEIGRMLGGWIRSTQS